MIKKVLTIAGSDCSGGAGIQADIKTITAHKMYAMSVITALTAQNTTGVYGVSEVSPEFVGQQIDCIFSDIRPEAETLSGFVIKNASDMKNAAKKVSNILSGGILIKGGHLETTANDLLYIGKKYYWFKSERIDNPNTHGTGCTLSSAIACNLAVGCTLDQSIQKAKEYVLVQLKQG